MFIVEVAGLMRKACFAGSLCNNRSNDSENALGGTGFSNKKTGKDGMFYG